MASCTMPSCHRNAANTARNVSAIDGLNAVFAVCLNVGKKPSRERRRCRRHLRVRLLWFLYVRPLWSVLGLGRTGRVRRRRRRFRSVFRARPYFRMRSAFGFPVVGQKARSLVFRRRLRGRLRHAGENVGLLLFAKNRKRQYTQRRKRGNNLRRKFDREPINRAIMLRSRRYFGRDGFRRFATNEINERVLLLKSGKCPRKEITPCRQVQSH